MDDGRTYRWSTSFFGRRPSRCGARELTLSVYDDKIAYHRLSWKGLIAGIGYYIRGVSHFLFKVVHGLALCSFLVALSHFFIATADLLYCPWSKGHMRLHQQHRRAVVWVGNCVHNLSEATDTFHWKDLATDDVVIHTGFVNAFGTKRRYLHFACGINQLCIHLHGHGNDSGTRLAKQCVPDNCFALQEVHEVPLEFQK